MSLEPPTQAELTALLITYCNASVHAEREVIQGSETLVYNTAKAVSVVARARGCTTEELFTAFEAAWKREQSWGALPHALQTAAYERALSRLAGLFITDA